MTNIEQEKSGFWATILKPITGLTALAVACIPFRSKLAGFIEKNKSNIIGQTTGMFTGITSEAGKINSIPRSLANAASFAAGIGLTNYTIDCVFSKRVDKPAIGDHTERLQKQEAEATIERH